MLDIETQVDLEINGGHDKADIQGHIDGGYKKVNVETQVDLEINRGNEKVDVETQVDLEIKGDYEKVDVETFYFFHLADCQPKWPTSPRNKWRQ